MKTKLLGAAAALAMLSAAADGTAAEYPARDLQGIIMWGAGGATDTVARAVTPLAESALGKQVVLVNKPGGTGAISTAFVAARPSDGYTLLYGAENPQLHKVLELSQIDYADFYPVNILAHGVAVIVANNDMPWKSVKDLVADAQKRPGEIKMGSTGPGGLPHVVGALMKTVIEFPVTPVPFDGEGPGITALLGGHVDFMPAGLSAAAEHIKAGRVKVLAVVNNEEISALPGVPPITADFADFGKYLPWGPFYGVFVKRDVPDAAKDKLVTAFKAAATDPKFVDLMVGRGNIMMNIAGAEADEFLKKWQSTTAWVLHEAKATKASPEQFGIPKP
ncbi:ABC transporter substrate-binding protein [Thalassobaculum fulvum]|uniref:ABC transporter substrate-binding protein n=1 Tax=Thalassobaculum fulvum TaxID=1633335 RepID=A0A918XX82_9PROT|nr:tripartite tricarboxylate transporter substrate binding protein [Thalassobaculum fulvum]GHD62046.1 ABC transporter substrate-binding protein [Thalassobaculum fulvum]